MRSNSVLRSVQAAEDISPPAEPEAEEENAKTLSNLLVHRNSKPIDNHPPELSERG